MRKGEGYRVALCTIVLCFFGGLMLILNFLTPFGVDDFGAAFDFDGNRITSIKECWNLARHYTGNGRFLSIFVTYAFMIFPKYVFNIINAGMFVAMLYSLGSFCSTRKWLMILLGGGYGMDLCSRFWRGFFMVFGCD